MSEPYGLNPLQFGLRIIRPLLADIGLQSPAAERLVLGTALQESRLQYLQQIRGPAIGVYQMEPATYRDLRASFLNGHLDLARKVDAWAIDEPDVTEMEGNLYFATAMCRVLYRRVREALPPPGDPWKMAAYYKTYYNTPLGSASIGQAQPHFWAAIQAFDQAGAP